MPFFVDEKKAINGVLYVNKVLYNDGASVMASNAIVVQNTERVRFCLIQKQNQIMSLYGLGNG